MTRSNPSVLGSITEWVVLSGTGPGYYIGRAAFGEGVYPKLFRGEKPLSRIIENAPLQL
jgi:hypothetical protein